MYQYNRQRQGKTAFETFKHYIYGVIYHIYMVWVQLLEPKIKSPVAAWGELALLASVFSLFLKNEDIWTISKNNTRKLRAISLFYLTILRWNGKKLGNYVLTETLPCKRSSKLSLWGPLFPPVKWKPWSTAVTLYRDQDSVHLEGTSSYSIRKNFLPANLPSGLFQVTGKQSWKQWLYGGCWGGSRERSKSLN